MIPVITCPTMRDKEASGPTDSWLINIASFSATDAWVFLRENSPAGSEDTINETWKGGAI